MRFPWDKFDIYIKIYIPKLMHEVEPRELEWIGTSRKDMQALPLRVRRVFGYALYAAQLGQKPRISEKGKTWH